MRTIGVKTYLQLLRHSTLAVGLITGIGAIAPTDVAAATFQSLSDEVSGSLTPISQVDAAIGTQIQNNDFTIERSGFNSTLGNGIDEFTFWKFDFSDQSFGSIASVTSANIQLTLTPNHPLITTDAWGITGLKPIAASKVGIPSLPLGSTSDISIDLLDFYSSQQLRSVLNKNNQTLPMFYQDDAIVSRADAVVEVSVPEPGSIISLLAIATVAAGATLQRQSQRR